MAKELPYFKFEPSEWENGTIQMVPRDAKGLFMDLCSMYWARLGELPYALALQKLCNGDKDALQPLLHNKIIGNLDGQIIIEFLDEQLDEFQKTSEKRRDAANKRWSDASALQKQSKSNAIREEKIREEEIREDNKFSFKSEMINLGFYEELIIDWLAVRRKKKATNTQTALRGFLNELKKSGLDKNEVLKKCVENSWAGFKSEWITNISNNGKSTGKETVFFTAGTEGAQ